MFNLGHLHDGAGDVGKAEAWWTRAADAGHSAAIRALIVLLINQGRLKEADEWRRWLEEHE